MGYPMGYPVGYPIINSKSWDGILTELGRNFTELDGFLTDLGRNFTELGRHCDGI